MVPIGTVAISLLNTALLANETIDSQKGLSLVLNEVRAETVRPNDDRAGRPLPLAAHWNSGDTAEGLGTAYQLELISNGHHVLPALDFPEPDDSDEHLISKTSYYQTTLQTLAQWSLPFTLKGTQWEQNLYTDDMFWKLPLKKNPNVITSDGALIRMLSPMGAIEPWRKLGVLWIHSNLMKKLQAWYPNPPRVLLLSNNEARKLHWGKIDGSLRRSKRYLERYGRGEDDDSRRRIVSEGWVARYDAMQDAMRGALVSPAWRENVQFIGYDAFGPAHFGRWSGWMLYSLYTLDRMDPNHLMWDGGSVSYYTHNWNASTDFRVWSPQIEAMNWVFMQRKVLDETPDFWFEMSVWDGSWPEQTAYRKRSDKIDEYRNQYNQEYTPARYAGFVQFGMWLLTPRAVREFRPYLDTKDRVGEYFESLVAAVDRVYTDLVLKRFWRKSQLVPNQAHQHPYQHNVPERYKGFDRWFLLDTSLDPERPWSYSTEIPVFSLARVLGDPGHRHWLVYAHSPLSPRKNVEITIPEFDKITVDVAVSGSFFYVQELDRSVVAVAQPKR